MSRRALSDRTVELVAAAEVRPVSIDELSTVRYIHASALSAHGASCLSRVEIATFARHVYSDAYTSGLCEAARTGRLLGAAIGDELVGTATWLPANDSGAIARMHGVYVRPLFMGGGIGRRLVLTVEDQARRAGFTSFMAKATLNAADFFSRLGYEASSRGVWTLGPSRSLQVMFMRKRLRGLRAAAPGTEPR